ncbi:hypothetical protein GXW82_44630 [Streptacidiphilus sp. 4-A2]|nr:hypothetical protein [Streptacidiphilus sp. 4-A2]
MNNYFIPPTAGSGPLPHQQYAQAVHAALVAADAEPVEWYTYDSDDGMAACYFFRPYAPEPRPDGTVPRTVRADVWWGHGVELRWTEPDGWGFVPLDEHSEPAWDGVDPLPLPVLAAPDAVAAVAPLLLNGSPEDAEPSTAEWEHAAVQRAALLEHDQRTARR